MKKNILLFILAIGGSVAFAQTLNKMKLDSFTNALDKNNKCMGSLCISKNGNVLYTKSMGHAVENWPERMHADQDTKYRIGSISKMFTAVMIFQLVDEKKIKRSDLLSKYFPEVPNAKKITIDNLLNHRSGL
ncbi:MAG: beta-lactamase family protein, partial [Bacteroidia bacterium]|nr:beta-lactamase family protein [Bacteroidia bacterium]